MKRAWIAVSAALVIAGIAAIVSVSVASRNAARPVNWAQVRGTVERLDGARVAYRYEVAGKAHRGEAPARPRANYTPGGPVLVFANPENSAESLLDLPPRPPAWPAVAGGMAILLGAVTGIWFWREGTTAKKRSPAAKAAKGRKPAAPLSRLQPPPPVKWNRGDESES